MIQYDAFVIFLKVLVAALTVGGFLGFAVAILKSSVK